MPKHQEQDLKKNAVFEENSAQNEKNSTKTAKLKTKTQREVAPLLPAESDTETQTQPAPIVIQKKAENHKQVSRSTILFVASMNYILFFMGFCACQHEPFARFHQNQALWMWIIMAILYLSFAFIPGVNRVAIPFVIMLHILWMFAGIGTALRGRAYPVPIFGKIKIIDWEKV